jgi:hypothetical protein
MMMLSPLEERVVAMLGLNRAAFERQKAAARVEVLTARIATLRQQLADLPTVRQARSAAEAGNRGEQVSLLGPIAGLRPLW